MNFYIGDSIELINPKDDNVEICDELLEYIYKISSEISISMGALCELDPYDDAVISEEHIIEIIDICDYLILSGYMNNYNDVDEAIEEIYKLKAMAEQALSMEKCMVSIGD